MRIAEPIVIPAIGVFAVACVTSAIITYETSLSALHLILIITATAFGGASFLSIRKEGLFSPRSIFFTYGLVFFFIVPLLQTSWDYWPSIPYFTEKEKWITRWLSVHLLSLPFFYLGTKIPTMKDTSKYEICPNKALKYGTILIIVCCVSQLYVFYSFGGISGYIASYESRLAESIQENNPFAGYGMLFTLSESTPKLLAILLILKLQNSQNPGDKRKLILYSAVLLLAAIIFGGLRGSRSNIIWVMFWFSALYYIKIRSLKKSEIILGLAFVAVFMSFYSYFKYGGTEGVKSLLNQNQTQDFLLEARSIESPLKLVLVRDIGRADVQAYTYQLYSRGEYDHSLGRSLYAGAVSFLPAALVPHKPESFTKEKTEIFWGKGTYSENSYSTLLLGLSGEFFVNFGYLGVPLYFLVFGLIVSYAARIYKKRSSKAPSTYIYPVLLLILIQFFIADSNVITQFSFKYLLLPVVLLTLSLKRNSSGTNHTRL